MPVPWIQAIGNTIAPAIRKPQDAALRQTTMCVSHDAMAQMMRAGAHMSSIPTPLPLSEHTAEPIC